MRFKLSQDDINRNKLVEPELWYNVEVINVYDEPTKSGDSTNTKVDLRITSGPYKDMVVTRTFNEKAPSFIIPYLKANGVEPEPDVDYDLKATQGNQLRAFIKHREWSGTKYNDAVDFKPID